MKKSDRQLVFDMYGGKCAYCGCELLKGWHVDHKAAIRRRKKYVGGHSIENGEIKYEERRLVNDGCDHPENDHIDNWLPACASCNINKHEMTLEQFRAAITKYVESLNLYNTNYKIAKRYGLITETNIAVEFYFESINPQ